MESRQPVGSRANGHRAGHHRRAAGALVTTACTIALSGVTALPAAADENVPLNSGECKFNTTDIKETPWSLQRLMMQQLWAHTKGEGVRVAVIDTGIDAGNDQIKPAIGAGGKTFVKDGKATEDRVGHGTKVAGIIAAQPRSTSGFYGLAPAAKVIPFQQTDQEKPGTADSLAKAVSAAVDEGVDIINISQGTDASEDLLPTLKAAVAKAADRGVLIVASAGNDGASGKEKRMYPAAFQEYDNVLAVAASDRNNERAAFSQPGDYVDIAAPGVDMVSTVPDGGNCVDQGTSFAAPYAAGAAALLKSLHKDWKPRELIWHLEQTAERVNRGPDHNIGWGVIDPVAALNDTTRPTGHPTPDKPTSQNNTKIQPAALTIGESPEDRRARISLYIVGGGLLAVAVVVGASIALRDWRRKTAIASHGETHHG
ncbi:type VII secretion-associated serine protease mycosin [Streptomyces benahoarensis]|uniref:Type VII secretion-associated serine protease mycosin n=1 Tax=Streptomyces benahoarensis TaxID=2595054 RepID=A0A553ZFQ9_9ACTN|nr:type VII secretion-associated serine protease mycosin [Streptomyces benahoarensis]TSB40259.1 type VII secretion-associated serine protease mycosin [Streptomyces benahoarensis]